MITAMIWVCSVLAILYVATGFLYGVRAWQRVGDARREGTPNAEERSRLRNAWNLHYSAPHAYPRPDETLDEYDRRKTLGSVEYAGRVSDARYRAYRRSMMAPLWPLLLVSDVYSGYTEAREGRAPWVLREQQEALEKAVKHNEALENAKKGAQDALDNAKEMMS